MLSTNLDFSYTTIRSLSSTMSHVILLFGLLSSFLLDNSFAAPAVGCSINIPQLDPEPIVVTKSNLRFIYGEPNSKHDISIPSGSSIIISCPGSSFKLGSSSVQTIEAVCVSGPTFKSGSSQFNFKNIKCTKEAFHTARYTGKSCESNGKEAEIGFLLDSKQLVQTIRICFDSVKLNPLYSTYDLTRSIGLHESGVERITFIEDNFYKLNVKVNDLYVRGGQRKTINKLLGLPANSTEYIKNTGDLYLARGHLTAKADFVYAHQQLATFHYVNVAPQWQTFNGKNWATVEANVRDYAEDKKLDLKVYTGVYGVATLPHAQSGKAVPLYLYAEAGKAALPVPELFWKVVYDPLTQRGVAILGVNNPYLKAKKTICTDIAALIKWNKIGNNTANLGYIYACTIQDFVKKVPYLPKLDVKGVLL